MEMEMETAGEPLSIQTTDRTVALQLPRQKGVCILTRLSPVSGKERAFALVPQLPSDACSHDTLVVGRQSPSWSQHRARRHAVGGGPGLAHRKTA